MIIGTICNPWLSRSDKDVQLVNFTFTFGLDYPPELDEEGQAENDES